MQKLGAASSLYCSCPYALRVKDSAPAADAFLVRLPASIDKQQAQQQHQELQQQQQQQQQREQRQQVLQLLHQLDGAANLQLEDPTEKQQMAFPMPPCLDATQEAFAFNRSEYLAALLLAILACGDTTEGPFAAAAAAVAAAAAAGAAAAAAAAPRRLGDSSTNKTILNDTNADGPCGLISYACQQPRAAQLATLDEEDFAALAAALEPCAHCYRRAVLQQQYRRLQQLQQLQELLLRQLEWLKVAMLQQQQQHMAEQAAFIRERLSQQQIGGSFSPLPRRQLQLLLEQQKLARAKSYREQQRLQQLHDLVALVLRTLEKPNRRHSKTAGEKPLLPMQQQQQQQQQQQHEEQTQLAEPQQYLLQVLQKTLQAGDAQRTYSHSLLYPLVQEIQEASAWAAESSSTRDSSSSSSSSSGSISSIIAAPSTSDSRTLLSLSFPEIAPNAAGPTESAAAAAIAGSSKWLAALAQQAPPAAFAAASAFAGSSLSAGLAIAALRCRLLSGHAAAASQGLQTAAAQAAKTWRQISQVLLKACSRRHRLLRAASALLQREPHLISTLQDNSEGGSPLPPMHAAGQQQESEKNGQRQQHPPEEQQPQQQPLQQQQTQGLPMPQQQQGTIGDVKSSSQSILMGAQTQRIVQLQIPQQHALNIQGQQQQLLQYEQQLFQATHQAAQRLEQPLQQLTLQQSALQMQCWQPGVSEQNLQQQALQQLQWGQQHNASHLQPCQLQPLQPQQQLQQQVPLALPVPNLYPVLLPQHMQQQQQHMQQQYLQPLQQARLQTLQQQHLQHLQRLHQVQPLQQQDFGNAGEQPSQGTGELMGPSEGEQMHQPQLQQQLQQQLQRQQHLQLQQQQHAQQQRLLQQLHLQQDLRLQGLQEQSVKQLTQQQGERQQIQLQQKNVQQKEPEQTEPPQQHLDQSATEQQSVQNEESPCMQQQQQEDQQQQQEKQRPLYSQRQQQQRRRLLQQRSRKRDRIRYGSRSFVARMLKKNSPVSAAAAADVSPKGSPQYTAGKEVEESDGDITAELAESRETRLSRVASDPETVEDNATTTALDRLASAKEQQSLAKQKLKEARRMRALRCMLAQKSETHAAAVAAAAGQTPNLRSRISQLKASADIAVARARSVVAASKQRAAAAIGAEETAVQELAAANAAVAAAEVGAAAERRAAKDSEEAGAGVTPHACSEEPPQSESPSMQRGAHAAAASPSTPAEPGVSETEVEGVRRGSEAAAVERETDDTTAPASPTSGSVPKCRNGRETKTAAVEEPEASGVVQLLTGSQRATEESEEGNASAALEARIARASAEAEGAAAAAAALLDSAISAPEVEVASAAAATTNELLLSSCAAPGSQTKLEFVRRSDGLLAAAAAAAMAARRAKRRLPGRLANRRRRIFAYCCRETLGDACTCTLCSKCKTEPAAAPDAVAAPAAAVGARCTQRGQGHQQQQPLQISLRSRNGRTAAAANVDAASSSSVSSSSRRKLRVRRGTRKRERRIRSSFSSPANDGCSSASVECNSESDWEGSITRRKGQPQYRRHQGASFPEPVAAPVAAAGASRRAEAVASGSRMNSGADPANKRQHVISLTPVVDSFHNDKDNVSNAAASISRSTRSGLRSALHAATNARRCPAPVPLDEGTRALLLKIESPKQHCGANSQQQKPRTASPRSSCRVLRSRSRHPAAAATDEETEAALELSSMASKHLPAQAPLSEGAHATVVAEEPGLPASPDALTEPADSEDAALECTSISSCSNNGAREPQAGQCHHDAAAIGNKTHAPFIKRPIPSSPLSHKEHEQEEQCKQEVGEQQRRRQRLPETGSTRVLRCSYGGPGITTSAAEFNEKTIECSGATRAPAVAPSNNDHQEHQSSHKHPERDTSALPLETAPLVLEDFRELLVSSLCHPKQQDDRNPPRTRKGAAAAILAAASDSRNNGSTYNTPSKSSHDACNRKFRSVRSAAAAVAAATAARLQANGAGNPKDFKTDVEAAAAEIARNISWNEKRRSYAAKIRGVAQPVWFAAKRRGIPQALQAAADLLIGEVHRRRPTQFG